MSRMLIPKAVAVLRAQTFKAEPVSTRQNGTCCPMHPIVMYKALLCVDPSGGRSSSEKVMIGSGVSVLKKATISFGAASMGTSIQAKAFNTACLCL